jgi:glycosyltransferase involved in cell wall biosynthesis
MPRVSVIIPTQCRPRLLRRAVKSAREAGEDVEVVVVDDASEDETRQVCSGMSGIKYVRLDRRQGVAGARNVGILASTAQYLSFLDDDDLKLPGSLDLQLALLERSGNAGMVCGTVLLGDDNCRPTGGLIAPPAEMGGDVFWRIVSFEYSPLPIAVVVRKECFLKVGLFKRSLAGIDDWDMWARVAELFPVATTPEPVAIYRTPTAGSEQGSSNLAAHYRRASRHQARLLRLPRALAADSATRAEARAGGRFRMSAHLLLQAADAQRRRGYGLALTNALAALRINPYWFCQPIFRKGIGKRLLRTKTRM